MKIVLAMVTYNRNGNLCVAGNNCFYIYDVFLGFSECNFNIDQAFALYYSQLELIFLAKHSIVSMCFYLHSKEKWLLQTLLQFS